LASGSFRLNLRIKPAKFDSGVGGLNLTVNFFALVVSIRIPEGHTRQIATAISGGASAAKERSRRGAGEGMAVSIAVRRADAKPRRVG
jgi:hypothetical protein